MRSLLRVGRDVAADSIEVAIEAFEVDCESGRSSLVRFWSGYGSRQAPSTLAALVKVDLQRRFERGERPKVIDYLEAFPILAESDDRVVSLVYEEFCLLQESGEDPDSREFCEDYAPWRDSLRSQLAYHRELSRAVGAEMPSVKFPDIGERFDRYQLHSILGTGGVARVYLATEDDLGGRRLAIKVSASFGQEHCILAKLDHRNIVPILTVAESKSGLRGICMPYRPGATLEELIRRIGRGIPPRSARAIGEALKLRGALVEATPEEQRAGWAGFPIERTFPEAVAWIALALANALSYLHKQGVFHRDIKPANILLAHREGPQLLDFNLAQDPSRPENAKVAQKGGTLPYMAPEQLKAFLDPSAWDEVGPAADLYSLGLVLRELLTGRAPEVPASRSSLPRDIHALLDRRRVPALAIREINPAVPPALESIVGKCLAFHPSGRYQGADELATDLRRFIDRKPLRHAPNPSKFERVVNFIYRNRQALAAAFLIALVSSIGYQFLRAPSASVEDDLAKAESHLDSGRSEELVLARVEFETLRLQHPNSARPPLCLAIAHMRLGDAKGDYISDLFKEANGKQDAADALRGRLSKEPDSATLLTNLGIVLTEKGDYEGARKALNRSLEIDPNGIAAISALAKLDHKVHRDEDAIRGFSRVIDLGRTRNLDTRTIYDIHKSTLPLYLHVLDGLVDGKSSADRRGRAADYLAGMESNLGDLKGDYQRLKDERGGEMHRYTVAFYEGCIAAFKALLDVAPRDPDRSKWLFQEAYASFEKAKEAVSEGNPYKITLRTWVEEQEQKLNRRQQARDAL